MNLKVRIAIISVAINVLLVGLKLLVTRWPQSASVLTDAIYSLPDTLIFLLVLSGLVLGARGQGHAARWRYVEAKEKIFPRFVSAFWTESRERGW